MGMWGGVKYQYSYYCTRYFAVLANLSVIRFFSFTYGLFIFNLVLFTLYLFAFNNIINCFFTSNKLGNFHRFNYSLFLLSAIFYTTFRIGETWFWLASSSTYALSLGCAIWGVGLILKKNFKLIQLIGIFIFFSFVGGSNGTLSLFILVLFALVLFFQSKLNISKLIIRKLWFSMLVCTLAFGLLYLGPGNDIRSSCFEDISILESFFLNFKTTAMILLLRIPHVLPMLLLFSVAISLLFRIKNVSKLNFSFFKKIMLLMFCFIGLVFLFQWPITYKTQDVGAYRTLFPMSVLSLVFGSAFFYLVMQKNKLSIVNKKRLTHIVLSLIIVVQCGILIHQTHTVKKYADNYDARMEYLERNLDSSETLWLDRLPNSGFLYSAEISTSPKHFTNQHLKSGLGLRAEVALKGE